MNNSNSSDDSNRIGHKCWYREYKNRSVTPWRRGILRAWSTEHEEFESGPGPYPVAVIEDVETAGMRSTHVARVTFAEDMPSDEQKLAP